MAKIIVKMEYTVGENTADIAVKFDGFEYVLFYNGVPVDTFTELRKAVAAGMDLASLS